MVEESGKALVPAVASPGFPKMKVNAKRHPHVSKKMSSLSQQLSPRRGWCTLSAEHHKTRVVQGSWACSKRHVFYLFCNVRVHLANSSRSVSWLTGILRRVEKGIPLTTTATIKLSRTILLHSYVCMYVCMYVRMHVSMYVCMYVFM